MKKIKNKFILGVLVLIVAIIGYGIFIGGGSQGQNYSYIYLVSGSANINNQVIQLERDYKIESGDIIQTGENDSLAIITWGDGSITRLGPETRLEIDIAYVSGDNSRIQISFELLNGKTWSNVTSFFGEESYFKERFRDNEAAVRGTVFNLDLDNEYLYVTDHEVVVTTTSGEQIIVPERKPLSLNDFSFLQLVEFIKNVKDAAWEDLNKSIDIEFINKLKNDLEVKIADIKIPEFKKLNDEQKKEVYDRVLSQYQAVHFLSPGDDLYEYKLELQNKLLSAASTQNKEKILQISVFEVNEAIRNGAYQSLEGLLDNVTIHAPSSEIISKLNNSINIDILPDSIQESIKNKLELLGSGTEIIEGITNQIQNDAQEAVQKSKSFFDWIRSLFAK